MICANCKQEFVGEDVGPIGKKGAEFWECKPEAIPRLARGDEAQSRGVEMRKAEYQHYLATPHWYAVRARRLAKADFRCEFQPYDFDHGKGSYGERCPETARLEVHHRHYNSLGAEADKDLEVLCRFHHLVRTVLNIQCEMCCLNEVVSDEEEAIDLVKQAIEDYGTIDDVTLDCIDMPDMCAHCDDIFTKDD